jgi:hypothetical protein
LHLSAPFLLSFSKIHSRWRAYTVLSRFTPEQREQLKQKALAQQMLKGRRAYWLVPLRWHAHPPLLIIRGAQASACTGLGLSQGL